MPEDKSIETLVEILMPEYSEEDKQEGVKNLKAYLEFVMEFAEEQEELNDEYIEQGKKEERKELKILTDEELDNIPMRQDGESTFIIN